MNKSTIILLLILTTFSCRKEFQSEIDRNQLQNKTFSLLLENKQDTFFIEFQDTTYQIFGISWEGKIPWRLSRYENIDFLVLDGKAIGIERNNENNFECTHIGLSDNKFTLVERKPKWDEKLIFGTWVKKKNNEVFDSLFNDNSTNQQLESKSQAFSEKKIKRIAYYEIDKDSIKLFDANSINKSEIEINNSSEFILMNLENNELLGKEWEWKIKKLDTEFMIVEKRVSELGHC
jgi:hypothetical protein